MRLLVIALAFILLACGSPATPTQPPPTPGGGVTPARVLLFTATTGYRHDSIATAKQVMTTLATSTGEFVVTTSEDVGIWPVTAWPRSTC